MHLSMSEILEKTSKLASRKEKIDFLRRNYTKQFHFVVLHAFDPRVKFMLPEGTPPYNPCPTGEAQGALYSEARRLYLFVEGISPKNLTQTKREILFISLLESIDPNDAKLLCAIKDKKIPYKGITEKLIEEAYGKYNG